MVMILNKRIRRVILQNKAQYLGAIVMVVLSCMLFTLLNVIAVRLETNLTSFITHANLEDAKVILQKPLTGEQALEEQFDIRIEERRELDLIWQDNATLRLFERSEQVNIPAIVEGADLTGDDDILLNPAFAHAHGINIGDTITLADHTFTVRGLMSVPDYLYALKSDTDLVPDPLAFGTAVISKNKMKQLGAGTLYYTIKHNGEPSPALQEYLAVNHGLLYWKNIDENARYTLATAKIEQTAAQASKLPMSILFLTCLLLATTMWRMVKMDFAQIGTLYAMGYKKREILFHYLRFPLIISLVGGVVGTGLGLALLAPMNDYLALYFNIPLKETANTGGYLIGSLLIPMVFLIPAVTFVVWRALRLKPVTLMRGHAQNTQVSRFVRMINLQNVSFKTKFKTRETLRNLSKSFLMLFGVTLASVFLMFGFVAQSSTNYLLKSGYTDTFKYQYNTMFNSLQQANSYNGEVYNVAPFRTSDETADFMIYGLTPDATLIQMQDERGNSLRFDQTLITKALADKLQLGAGDTLDVVNRLTGQTSTLTINAVAEVYTGFTIYLPLTEFNSMVGMPSDTFIGVYSLEPLQVDSSRVMKVESREDTLRAYDSMLEPMKYTLLATGGVSFLIALIVIYVITSLIIEENKINISMLKVLGYTNREINALVLNAGTIPVVLGFLLAIPTVFTSLDLLLQSALQGMDIAFPIRVDWWFLVLGFLIIYGTYELSKWLAKKKVFAVSMAESLKTQRE